MKEKEKLSNVDILWTGGWDSSYRMVELSRTNKIVQPIYVYGQGRISEQYERQAMFNILAKLREKTDTIAEIKSIKFIHVGSIPQNEQVSLAYSNIHEKTKLGSQHEWLARYAFENPGIELGTELASVDNSKILNTIRHYGELVYNTKTYSYELDEKKSTQDIMYVLGNFSYPIIDKTGRDMLKNIKQWGYEDVMQHVWVCHAPIFGKPCGICHPCELKIETDMDFLMSTSSLKRYSRKNNKYYKYLYRIYRKISRKLDDTKILKMSK